MQTAGAVGRDNAEPAASCVLVAIIPNGRPTLIIRN